VSFAGSSSAGVMVATGSLIGVPFLWAEHLPHAAARQPGQGRAQRGPQALALAAADGAAAALSSLSPARLAGLFSRCFRRFVFHRLLGGDGSVVGEREDARQRHRWTLGQTELHNRPS